MFELPYYLALLALCLRYRLRPKLLAKANWALDHGEIGLGSKYETQRAFDQQAFPATVFLPIETSVDEKLRQLQHFAERVGFPIILKPDMGAVGKGLLRLNEQASLRSAVTQLRCSHLAQAYVDLPCEYGIFFVRLRGRGQITGINRKHFPTVIGDGTSSLAELAAQHPRYTDHWPLFLRYLELDSVPAAGQPIRLSFVGSHTMGCCFTNDQELLTGELTQAVLRFCDSQPGYNFGRLDVRAASDGALRQGEFTVIEANGVASLPTHMFDPRHSLIDAYRIFLAHAGWLAQVAVEHRTQPMQLDSWRHILRRLRSNTRALAAAHESALNQNSQTNVPLNQNTGRQDAQNSINS